jgi:hypothetical protein
MARAARVMTTATKWAREMLTRAMVMPWWQRMAITMVTKRVRTKAARGNIMVTKRARARAARGMMTATKRARVWTARGMAMATRVAGDKEGDGKGG